MLSISNDDFILYIVTMLFVGVGVFGKDYSNTLSGKDKSIKFFRIIFVMVTISTLMLAFKDLFQKFNTFFYLFACITFGWMNYSLPNFLDSVGEALINFFKDHILQFFNKDDKYDKLLEQLQTVKDQNEKIIKNQEETSNVHQLEAPPSKDEHNEIDSDTSDTP